MRKKNQQFYWIGKVQIELLMVLLLFGAGLSLATAIE
jgi:hypothetical protein